MLTSDDLADIDRRIQRAGGANCWTGTAGSIAAVDFVGWYNAHPHFGEMAPDLSADRAVVIGNGNVALDVARILAKAPTEFVGSDIVAHAFEASPVTHLTASHMAENHASGQVLGKVGFRYTGETLAWSEARRAKVHALRMVLKRRNG